LLEFPSSRVNDVYSCRGAVSRDGRIQAGDLLLDINGNSLDGMSSRDAVAMLRQAVQHRR